MIFKEFQVVTQTGPAHTPEIKISKKYWTSFPEILDEVSRICQ